MNYDEWKLDNPYNDEQDYIHEDIWLTDYLDTNKTFLIESINDSFYCNGGKVTHEQMINKLDIYTNVIDNLKDFKKEDIEPLTCPIFNINVEINLLIETIDKFNI